MLLCFFCIFISLGPVLVNIHTHHITHKMAIFSVNFFQGLFRICETTYHNKMYRSQEKVFISSVIKDTKKLWCDTKFFLKKIRGFTTEIVENLYKHFRP